ncbi:hypothetical protein GCM10011583_55280 [Streptomyces camponoticapitis]|uniref:DUF946 domain-containing protein n=1 Tax=Streptomyces camponoticapitis TaxID=1616125 RepID=A0ABQ2ELI0_9ACTN|nr:hypothetical protein GCM10011583_55280 [Streptomyces camponoticapitis]
MVTVVVSVSVALVGCGPEKPKEYTGAEPSEASATAAAQFAPLVRLHKKESLLPMDATRFIERSVLRFDHDGLCRDEEPVADAVDPRRLGLRTSAEQRYRHQAVEPGEPSSQPLSCPGHAADKERAATEVGAGFYLDPPEEVRKGEGPGAAAYWEYHKHKTDPARSAYVYWFFYGYNKLTVGNRHEGDWERVAVQLRDGKPQAVTFAKHGSDPCRVKWADLNQSDGHPTVYSALGSHGSYPTAGYHRVSVTFDRTSEGGAEWRTWDKVRPVEGEPWWGYGGWWGAQEHVDGFNGPMGPYPNRQLPGIFTDEPCGGADKPPSDPPAGEKPPADPPGEQPAPRTKEGAIQRYEEYLHAVGREDIDTVCEVAGPAAKQAEDQGFGPCTATFLITFQMISPARKKALRTATVDPQRVVELAPDRFEMPAASIRSSETFSESDLGDSTMGYMKDEWYVVD